MYIYTHTYIHACIHTCIHAYTRIYTYMYTSTCICRYIYIYIHTYIGRCNRIHNSKLHIQFRPFTHTHTHMYLYMYIYIIIYPHCNCSHTKITANCTCGTQPDWEMHALFVASKRTAACVCCALKCSVRMLGFYSPRTDLIAHDRYLYMRKSRSLFSHASLKRS